MTVSLRLPAELSKRLAKLAKKTNTTAHALMIDAIREKIEAREIQLSFYAEAQRRLREMKKSGDGIAAEEVFAYLRAKSEGKNAKRPKARKLP